MTEFNTPVTAEQVAFLAADRAQLYTGKTKEGKTIDGKAVWQRRVKMAGEAYTAAKAIHNEHSLTGLAIKAADDEDDDSDLTFPTWQTYRDNFILDWIANRTIKTVEEADAMFDREVNEALESIGDDTADIAAANEEQDTAADLPSTTPVAKKKSYYKPKSKVKAVVKAAAKKKVVAKPKKKVAAKKKSGGSASAKAQVLIEKYAARDWSRKDIIEKLQSQLDMGAAYASTLYQKFA